MTTRADEAHGKVRDLLCQPFRGADKVIVEKRTSTGALDFSDPQPPSAPMTFDAVYALYFAATPRGGRTAGWADLKAWLDSKGWVVRACTWVR